MMRTAVLGLAAMLFAPSLALAQGPGRPGPGQFDRAGPQAPWMQAIHRLSQRVDRLEKAVKALIEHERREQAGPAVQQRRRAMQGGQRRPMMRQGAMRARMARWLKHRAQQGPPGGECPHCGKAKKQREPAARRPQARAQRRQAPQGGDLPQAARRLHAENQRLKAEVQKLQAQLKKLAQRLQGPRI